MQVSAGEHSLATSRPFPVVLHLRGSSLGRPRLLPSSYWRPTYTQPLMHRISENILENSPQLPQQILLGAMRQVYPGGLGLGTGVPSGSGAGGAPGHPSPQSEFPWKDPQPARSLHAWKIHPRPACAAGHGKPRYTAVYSSPNDGGWRYHHLVFGPQACRGPILAG
jgi:hypothetical protein